jgi:TrmH family RNA methyltransferase
VRITSTRNPAVLFARSLDRTSARREHGQYLIEGVRLTTEAIAAGRPATFAFYEPELLERTEAGSRLLAQLDGWADKSHEVAPHVLESIARTETPSGVVAVIRATDPPPLSDHAHDRLGLALDRIADPGNLGTILRTAAALGVRYVLTLPESADLFAPKVVRAAMGAHFGLDLYQHEPWNGARAQLGNVEVVAATTGAGDPLQGFSWPSAALLVVGSEAHGLSSDVESSVGRQVHIPMSPGVESLNAAVAAGIVMYAALTAPDRRRSVTDERDRRSSK